MKRIVRVALAVGVMSATSPWLVACGDDDKTVGEKIDEAGEELGDEIDDHTDED